MTDGESLIIAFALPVHCLACTGKGEGRLRPKRTMRSRDGVPIPAAKLTEKVHPGSGNLGKTFIFHSPFCRLYGAVPGSFHAFAVLCTIGTKYLRQVLGKPII